MLSVKISSYDKEIERLCKTEFPETIQMRQIKGVGPIIALAFALTVEVPERFGKSRDVGPYFGLTPRQFQSGANNRALGITKRGDTFMRRLLLQGAHYIMGAFGPDCLLRRHGERILANGGKNAKKRALVAVSRKLAVLMHRLWVNGEVYDPFYGETKAHAV